MIFCWLEAILTKLAESVLARKKIQMKACYKILGTENSSYAEFHSKTTQIPRETELYPAKWK